MANESLNGRIVLITGAGGGQGSAHARALSAEGAVVYLTDINVDAIERVAQELKGQGAEAFAIELDVSSSDSWNNVAAKIGEQHGKLDVLVNNAGILDMASFEEADERSWQRTVDVNQKSIFLGIKSMLELLRKSGNASIVNTSSIYALIGAPDYVAYQATKAAIVGMTKSAAATLGADNIRVNSIHPGYVDTAMWQAELEVLPEGTEAETLGTIPLGRYATPEDIANVVKFLASDDSSYITGTQLIIDGGVSSV